jgi:hypothetical protein
MSAGCAPPVIAAGSGFAVIEAMSGTATKFRLTLARCMGLVANLAMAALLLSCETSRCPTGFQPEPAFVHSDSAWMWPGDTYRVLASGRVGCAEYITVSSNPADFTYWTGDSSIATVSDRGVVTAVGPGVTRVYVSHGAGPDELIVTVTPRVASIEMTFSPEAPKVGDVVTVAARPLDASGNVIFAARMTNQLFLFRNGVPTTSWPFQPVSKPFEYTFTATEPGTYQFHANVKRTNGQVMGLIRPLQVP